METLQVLVGVSSALGMRVAGGLLERGRPVAGTWNNNPVLLPGVSLMRRCEATDLAAMEDFARECRGISERISLTYLAGVSRNAFSHRMALDDWEEVLRVGLTGAWVAARAFLPVMREAGWGRIIFAGSVTGRLGVPGTSAYSAAKAGLVGLTRTAARENAARGVTVNCLELGYMDAGLTYTIPEELRNGILDDIPAGRFGDPANIVEAILFLENADYVTGSVMSMSGGL